MALASAAAARHAALQILAEGRFHQAALPRPLHGLAEAVGSLLSDPLNAIERFVLRLGRDFPGGVAAFWVVLALAVVIAAAALASRRARNALAEEQREVGLPGPAELERAAAHAEREGRLGEAVRLRFAAGLLRLAERGGFSSLETMPSRDIGALVGSERFARLSSRFDEIAYGSSPATAEDVETQRREWPQILAGSSLR